MECSSDKAPLTPVQIRVVAQWRSGSPVEGVDLVSPQETHQGTPPGLGVVLEWSSFHLGECQQP